MALPTDAERVFDKIQYVVNSQIEKFLLQYLQKLTAKYYKPDGVVELRWGSRCGIPPLTKMLFAINNCWYKENQFSPMQCH